MSDAEVIGQAAALFLCLAGLGGILCRQDMLKAGTHRIPVLGMHVGLCVACGLGALDAAQGQADFGDAAAAVGTLCWLWLSWFTWAGGPPWHTESSHVPLDDPHTKLEAS